MMEADKPAYGFAWILFTLSCLGMAPLGAQEANADSLATRDRVAVAADSVADTAAFADTLPKAPMLELDVKTVKGQKPDGPEKSPWRPQIVTREEIDRDASNNLLDLLDGKPGLIKKIDCSVCNTAQIRLLGLAGSYTQILVDGMPAYSGLSLVYGLEQLSLANVDRVEIIQGAGSVKHGGGAVAGTINVITANPKPNPEARASVRYGEHNEQDYEGAYSGRHGRLGLQFNFAKNSSPAINPDGDEVEDAAEYDRAAYAGRLGFPLGSRIRAHYGFQSSHEDRFGGTTSSSRKWIGEFQPETTFVGTFGETITRPLIYQEYVRSQRVAYEAGAKANWGQDITQDLRLSFVEHFQDAWYGYIHLAAKQRLFLLENDFTWHLDRHEILAGGSFTYDGFRDNRSLGSHAFAMPALYAQEILKPGEAWRLHAGLRGDWHGDYGLMMSPRAGALWDALPGLRLRLTGGGGFRTFSLFSEDHSATTTDVYYVEPIRGLEPERSWSLLGGAEWLAASGKEGYGLSLDFSAWHTWIDGLLQALYLESFTSDGRQRVRYVNRDGLTLARGLQATADIDFPLGFEIQAGGNIFDNTVDAGDGPRRIYNTPEYLGFGGVSWELPSWGLRLSGEGSVVGPQVLREVRLLGEVIKPERESESYVLFDALLEKAFGSFTLSLGGKNLGDFYQAQREPVLYARGYQVATGSVFAPLKGRTLYVGMRTALRGFKPPFLPAPSNLPPSAL